MTPHESHANRSPQSGHHDEETFAELLPQSDGRLVVTLQHLTLSGDELASLLTLIRNTPAFAACTAVIFDLRHVEQIGPQWTVVWATWIAFARQSGKPCRVENLNTQPAATAALFARSREMARLLAKPDRLAA